MSPEDDAASRSRSPSRSKSAGASALAPGAVAEIVVGSRKWTVPLFLRQTSCRSTVDSTRSILPSPWVSPAAKARVVSVPASCSSGLENQVSPSLKFSNTVSAL
jgi:hypothetical protein